ncbi:hypothetical protein C1645_754363 [Glomus cerebriforme]|uniref:BTB domain-containing protein n=1 Tax=Glomus cerebriforme TaxID=658196 RepID=A0A397TFH2_9GLOM|nr:hypothetical protein C1645_754363 [Glomus cerebriforme]
MNDSVKQDDRKLLIGSKIKNSKLFLNEDDPSNKKCWVSGKELVLGIQKDIKEGMYKVNKFLTPYEDLLLCAGARKMKDNEYKEPEIIPDQKEALLNSLLDKLIRQSKNDHDIIFIVGKEEKKIYANRYVLSAVSTYFESAKDEIKVPIEDIQPDTFLVFLRWSYGQSFEDASSILRRQVDFKAEHEYETYYLSFLMHILKVTNIYKVKTFKDIVERTIIKEQYVNVNYVSEILKCSKECEAQESRKFYENHVKSNKELFKDQLSGIHKNELNDLIEPRMLKLLNI